MDSEPARIRRGAPRGRGRGRGRGGGRRYSDKHQPALSTNADRYVESGDEDDDPNIPMSKSEGQDLESLLQNLQLTEWGAYSHHRILVNELNREPPLATDGSHPRELALDMSELALSLASLPLHEVLDIDPECFQDTETSIVKTPSGRVSCRLILEDPAAVEGKEVEGGGAKKGEPAQAELAGDMLPRNPAKEDAKDDVADDPLDAADDRLDANSDANGVVAKSTVDESTEDGSELSDELDLFDNNVHSSHAIPRHSLVSTSSRPTIEHPAGVSGDSVFEGSKRITTTSGVDSAKKDEEKEPSRGHGCKPNVEARKMANKNAVVDDLDDGASSDDLDALLDMSRSGKQGSKGASLESWMDSL